MKTFLFAMAKKLLWFWASKLLGPTAVSELVITMAEAHSKRTDTTTDDEIVIWLKKHLNGKTE